MRKLTLIALAVGLAAALAACGSDNENQLVGQALAADRDHREGPRVPGRHPARGAGQVRDHLQRRQHLQRDRGLQQDRGHLQDERRNGLTINPGISTLALCPEGSFGDLFVHGLTRAETYEIANETLTITLKDKGTMTFVVGVAAGSTPEATATTAPTTAPTATPSPTPKPTPKPTAKPTPTPTPTATPTAKPTTAPTTAPTDGAHGQADHGADAGPDARPDAQSPRPSRLLRRPRRRPRHPARTSPASRGS